MTAKHSRMSLDIVTFHLDTQHLMMGHSLGSGAVVWEPHASLKMKLKESKSYM